MALSWSALGAEYPGLTLQVGALMEALRAAEVGPTAYERSAYLSHGSLAEVVNWLPPRELVLGVGYVVNDNLEPTAALFADVDVEPWQTVTELGIEIGWAERGIVRGRAATVALPRAMAFAGPGERCERVASTLGMLGTVGARVTASSNDAVLIAGHVGDSVGSVIHDPTGTRIGKVTTCLDPAQHPPLTPAPDVAVVELDRGVGNTGLHHSSTSGTARPRDDLEIHGATTGSSTTWIRGAALSWAGPAQNVGDWGYVLLTRDGITQGGDSGAPAFLAGTDRVVGHVVGGSPGVYSLVQEVAYQIGRSSIQPGVVPGLQGVSLR